MWADGNTSVADFGFNLFSILLYSLHSTSGRSLRFSLSFSQDSLAGNLHVVEFSSVLVLSYRASIVAWSSALASVLPLSERKNLGSSISLSLSFIWSSSCQYLESERLSSSAFVLYSWVEA